MHLFIGRKEELTNDFLNSFQALIINFGSQKQEIDEFLFRFCQSCDDVLGTVFISDGRGGQRPRLVMAGKVFGFVFSLISIIFLWYSISNFLTR